MVLRTPICLRITVCLKLKTYFWLAIILRITIIDRSTRWPEAVPLKSTTAEECAKVILRSWIPLFGVPSVITSDRGAQFTSSVWSALCRFLGIVHSPTTSFHPQSNGIVERFHRQLKVSLRARLAGTDWFHHLPLVLLGLRSVPREDSSVSASEALFGSPLVLPGEFLDTPELPSSEYLRKIQSILKNSTSVLPHHSAVPTTKPDQIPSSLANCSHVFIREHLPNWMFIQDPCYHKDSMGNLQLKEDTAEAELWDA